jgi:acyl-coenzyme A thioesterase 13
MKGKIMTAKTALRLYVENPHLPNTFSEQFGKNLVALDNFETEPAKALFRFKFPKVHGNIQATVHGGALASLIDISTTISMVRMTPLRTISINLNTEFLRVIKVEEEVEVYTEVTKIGKNVVFS